MVFKNVLPTQKINESSKSCFLNSHNSQKYEKLKLGNISQPNVLTTILPQGLVCAQKELWKAFLNSQDSKN